jgi:hypothetical protein
MMREVALEKFGIRAAFVGLQLRRAFQPDKNL